MIGDGHSRWPRTVSQTPPHSPGQEEKKKCKGEEEEETSTVRFTNRQNQGLISADRGTKATLMLTIPRSIFKSSTKDLSLPIFELVFGLARRDFDVAETRNRHHVMIPDALRHL